MKRHITSRLAIVLCFVLLMVAAVGCGQKDEINNSTGAAGDPQTTPEPENQQPEQQKQQIKVYYTDEELTGLIEQTSEIVYENDTEKIEEAFKALQSSGSDGAMSLWEKVKLLSAKIENGAVTLDIELPDEARFGAPGEALALEAIQKTMFQLDEVASLDILVAGEKVDSLMGHETLDHPIVKP